VEGNVWSSFRHDPRHPANAGLRAADADRSLVHDVLAEAYADGRLDREELDARSAAASSARTLGELPPLLADLVATGGVPAALSPLPPAELERRAVEKYRADRREAVLRFLGPSLVCVVIWAVVMPGGFFWPAFVIAATFVSLLRTVVRREDLIEANRRSLARRHEKDQRRELERRRRQDRPEA